MRRISILCLLLLITFPFGTHAYKSDWDNELSRQNQTKEIVVGELPEAKITLFAKEREGILEKFRLEENGISQHFSFWINVSNETYWPQLINTDINQDGEKELIIILTRGYGTGVINQEIHVLHKIDTNFGNVYREILVDNPITTLLKKVKMELTKSHALITIGHHKTEIEIDKLGIEPRNLFSDITTANLLRFEIIDNNLMAIIGAQVSPVGGFIGSFRITYEYKNEMYEAKKIEFVQVE